MNQDHEIRSLVLDRAAKWTIFVVKNEKLQGTPLPNLHLIHPPGIQTRFFLIGEIMTLISRFIYELFAIWYLFGGLRLRNHRAVAENYNF